MKRCLSWSAAILLCARCVCPAATVQLVDAKKFQTFLNSETARGLRLRALAIIPKVVVPNCDRLKHEVIHTQPLTAITFGADGVPNSGSWKSEIPVRECGNDTILNLYYSVARDGVKIDTTVGVPGWTHANLRLQKDAFFYAQLGASGRAKSCRKFVVINSKFDGTVDALKSAPKSVLPPWRETWVLNGCGHDYSVPLDFVPRVDGTQISQDESAVVERTNPTPK